MRYLSVCSGIEAASVAWHELGWEPVAFSEIEPFPSAVLAHHYPSVPNWGDMTKFKEWPDADVDVLVGGTPCQSFSVAGLRKGLDDPRGNLMLTYLAIANKYRPEWLVWENVPGVLSSNGGRDFGTFLGGLGELGYGFAYRILDAQYFGVAQRRRRVFVVANARDWRRAAAVLFERHSMSGNPAPRREAGKGVAQCVTTGTGRLHDAETETLLPHAFDARQSDVIQYGDRTGPLDTDGHTIGVMQPVATGFYPTAGQDFPCLTECSPSVKVGSSGSSGKPPGVQHAMQVRRLTPVECERLQGFPDGYTAIPWRKKPEAPDGFRYKSLGNSMAVPCMAWIGRRIDEVETLARGGGA
jgi:DNA (cytosine-5)-methyltransferase 1